MRKRIFSTVVLYCIGVTVAFGQALPLDTAVRTGKLPNGLTYFIRHNEQPKDRVLIYLVNKVGSVLEDDDQQGLAHFMEHMNFNGTAHFPKNELIDYLQKNGVRFGADINAYTSFDETVYQLPIPSDRPDVLHNGLEIVHDWAQGATLDPVEIDKERGVVLEEKRLGKGAKERMQRVSWPVLMGNSRYATRVPIGKDSVLNHFQPAVLRRFHHDWYRPDLQAVIIVGDIDAAAMEDSIRTLFADLKNPGGERVRVHYTIPLTGANRFVAITDKEMTVTQAEMLIKLPALKGRTVEDYRLGLMRDLFNEMLSGRLQELAQRADPPFLNGDAGFSGFMGGLDVFNASVVAQPNELKKGMQALWAEVIRVRRFGFTASELQRAKTALLSAYERAWKEKDKTGSASFVKEYQDHFLDGTAAAGIDAEYRLAGQLLPEISLAGVNALAQQYIVDRDRTILIEAPEKDKANLPDSATAVGWLAAVEAGKLTPYKDEVPGSQLLIDAPVAGKIVGEKKDERLGVTIWTLSNGARVVLKPTDFKNDEILFSAFGPGGTSLYPDADYESAANAAQLVGAGGAGRYSEMELRKYLAGKAVGLRFQIGERAQGLSGSANRADLATALLLLYAGWTEPRLDRPVIQGMVERGRASLANRENDPNSVFRDTISAVLGDHSVRRTGPSLEKLAEINGDKAFRIFKVRFSDASAFTFTFVGSFKLDSMRPLVERYLASLPATHAGVKAKDLGIHIPGGRLARTVYMGSEPKATVLLVFSGAFDYSMANVIRLNALRECLSIRLLQRLREEESGVYSPSVKINVSKLPEGRFSFMVSFGCAPVNADKLVASTLEEISKLRNDGPLAENVEKWRAEDRASRETELKTNPFWLGYLQSQEENGDPLKEVEGYGAAVDAVTPEILKKEAQEYLSGQNYIRFELLPGIKK